jgi:muramoyltetrapeptide carboxypeptidase
MRLLSQLPFSGFLSRPPLLVGYSDITALSLALYAQCGLVSVHGPMVGTLAQNPASTEELRALLFGKTPSLVTLEDPLCLSPGMAEGPLLGGNLSLVAALAGTPYLPSLEGAILFLEDIDEKPYRIDRMLTQLELSGALDGLAGLLLGDFTGCVDPNYPEPNWISVVAERFQPKKIPILAGFPAGHGPQNSPLLLGALTRIDASRGLVIQLEGLAPAA